MSFGTRLKEKRESLGITQPQLAEMLNVSKGAIGNWETDVNSPRAALLYNLFEILHCDANYLFQDKTRELYKNEASPEEFENIIKKYRFISINSPDGAGIVDTVLNREYSIAEKLKEQNEQIQKTNIEFSEKTIPFRIISYYSRIASACTGQIIFDMPPTKRIEIPNVPKYKKVDYAIGVDGNSMEPLYHDGDMLLIEMTEDINIGDIGIFRINNESYVKQLGETELISLNPDAKNIPLNESVGCMGKVIGKL